MRKLVIQFSFSSNSAPFVLRYPLELSQFSLEKLDVFQIFMNLGIKEIISVMLIYTGRVLILVARFAMKELVRALSLHMEYRGAHELAAIAVRLTLEDTSNSLQNCKGMFVL